MGHAKLANQDHSKEWPDYLRKVQSKLFKTHEKYDEPVIINMQTNRAAGELKNLVTTVPISEIIDNYDEQFAELQLSLNAHLYRANYEVQKNSIREALKEHYGNKKSWELGSWVYYPWSRQLVHVLAKDDFEKLRTIRNRDLITSKEQKILQDFNVACMGMSVGSASALALTISGISEKIKLADGAVISGSNLNRILTGVTSVGLEKSLVIARKLYEMNPYIRVHTHGKVTKNNISELFDKPWKINVVVDEIDDLESKIRVRIEAKRRGIPVVMATELADTVMLDVERFDLEPTRPLFHGLIPGIEALIDKTELNHREWMRHAVQIIGPKNMPMTMQKSLLKIGSTIVTHPQLGSTVMMTGGVLTYAIKQMALGKPMPSARSVIALEKILVSDYRKLSYTLAHRRHTRVIKKAIESI